MVFRDSGVGIAPHDSEWIFEAFTTHREGGHGLGLYISKELCKFNGITVAVDPSPSTGNFTALHAVTSTHALRVLMPFMSDRELLLRYHWQALTAAFIGIGSPRAKETLPENKAEWSSIASRAIASDDDHDAKLVFACREEQALRGDEMYRFAAALRVKLIS